MKALLLLLLGVGCAASGGTDTAQAARDSGSDSGSAAGVVTAGEPGELTTVSLMDAAAWVEVGARQDPFVDRPLSVDCTSLGYKEENDAFEVSTVDCAYGTFRQPLPYDVPEGTEIIVVYWFLELWSDDVDAEGHVVLSLDDGPLLEDRIPIPSGPETRKETVVAPRDLEAGEWLYFHIHNHGYNSWSLGILQADVPL